MSMFTFHDDPWPVIRFQPIMFLFLWIAMWHIVFPGGGNISMGISIWPIWLVTGFVCPPLLLLAWWLIEKNTGTWRYRGLWVRLAADVGELGVLLAFLFARLTSPDPLTDAREFGWIAISSMATFLVALVARDVMMLHVVNRVAAKGRHDDV